MLFLEGYIKLKMLVKTLVDIEGRDILNLKDVYQVTILIRKHTFYEIDYNKISIQKELPLVLVLVLMFKSTFIIFGLGKSNL